MVNWIANQEGCEMPLNKETLSGGALLWKRNPKKGPRDTHAPPVLEVRDLVVKRGSRLVIGEQEGDGWSTTIISGHRRQLKVTGGLGVDSSLVHGFFNAQGFGAIPFGGTESVAPSGAADVVEPKGIAGATGWSAWRSCVLGARTLPLVNSRIVA